ncbi:hypothetical protein SNOG_15137 [Parastagonospora nodorum SN15]|uniref:Uncharacterized protein n=1 Tax=Phaeosphaeria nodorum (strain SN15 / ATCC MYA-4574 / FGSC 10173) TaxID=321614 RepID=Q0TZ03_PHANO|nr:hypothetical protein SNOG_15137 [Parastagonospora nodorum SN15]EAT77362.1 hypothetical protein SNOG_15137 [Parastagonospora nodorum SN15]
MAEVSIMVCAKFGGRTEIGIRGGAGLLEHQRLRASGRKRKFAPRRSSEDYDHHPKISHIRQKLRQDDCPRKEQIDGFREG